MALPVSAVRGCVLGLVAVAGAAFLYAEIRLRRMEELDPIRDAPGGKHVEVDGEFTVPRPAAKGLSSFSFMDSAARRTRGVRTSGPSQRRAIASWLWIWWASATRTGPRGPSIRQRLRPGWSDGSSR